MPSSDAASSDDKIPASQRVQKKDEHGHPLLPCPGEAHSPEVGGHVDNCLSCAPRWGLVPAYRGASVEASFLLTMLSRASKGRAFVDGPDLPGVMFGAVEELCGYGYLSVFEREERRYGSTISFIAWKLTALGFDAIKRMNPKAGR